MYPEGITGVSLGNQLIYNTSNGLYRTDGTVAGTIKLSSYASYLIAAGNYVYFTQNGESDPSDSTAYNSWWVTDGSLAGTRLLTPSAPEGLGYTWYAESAVVANNSLYYVGSEGRIFQTDGTDLSWIDPVEFPQPQSAAVTSTYPQNIYDLMGISANGLVFSAGYAQYGQQLWVVSMQGAVAFSLRLAAGRHLSSGSHVAFLCRRLLLSSPRLRLHHPRPHRRWSRRTRAHEPGESGRGRLEVERACAVGCHEQRKQDQRQDDCRTLRRDRNKSRRHAGAALEQNTTGLAESESKSSL